MPSIRLLAARSATASAANRPVLRVVWAALCLATPSLGASAAAQSASQPAALAESPTDIGANLNISPKRLTLDRTQRSASVYIFNQGSASATFDIGLVDRVMLPDGRIAPLDDSLTSEELTVAQRVASAKPMLVAAPRRVTLAPGKGQTIRVRVSPGAELVPAAEYRTHLTVTTVPPRDAGFTAEQAAALRPGELSFSIRSVFGVSIPIIVRFAEPQLAAAIENARLHTANISADGISAPRPTPVATLDVVRSGANSLFGDLEVVAHKGRASEVIGAARGLGVYTEIERRTVQVPLGRAPRKGERLEVRFSDSDLAPGKLLAVGDLATP